MNTKQVIVVRKFPNLRTGKYCSQVAHASMSFLTKGGGVYCNLGAGIPQVDYFMSSVDESHAGEINHWLRNSFRKICVYVNSEEELEAVHQKALDSGLISHMITDNGATEFNGVKTKTCCAIGPAIDEKFEGITDHLPLL
jgi:PTH2 family peptidyl-tRNA hydrolase